MLPSTPQLTRVAPIRQSLLNAGNGQRGTQRGLTERTSLSNTLKALTMSFVGVVSVKPSMIFLKSAKATSFFPPIGSSAAVLRPNESVSPCQNGRGVARQRRVGVRVTLYAWQRTQR